MGKVHIERGGRLVPAQPQHVSHGQKRMGANQNAAGTKEPVFGQAFDDAKVLRRGGSTSQRQRRLRLRGQRLDRAASGQLFH